jgi:L-alanine-DL-glutamate epimerase-like enolase superfamily enzyme
VTQRTYVVVRIRTTGGQEGVGYAFGRSLPVAQLVDGALAPRLLGIDPRLPELVRHRLRDAYWQYADGPLFSVAVSAVDLALWDMLGKRLNAPLAELLGFRRTRVPICGVGGYTREGESHLEGLQAEMAEFLDLGCRAVKIPIGARDPATDVKRLTAVREALGSHTTLVVDAFQGFRSLEEAVRRLRPLEPFDLSYVEDPFPMSLAPLAAALRDRAGVLIGLGENASGSRAYRDLISVGAIDVVRCDATVVGGVRELLESAALASAHGLELSTHVHPDVHVHFGAALGNLHAAGLEYMTPRQGLDGLHELLGTQLEIRDGAALVPDRPGLGMDWDWAAVERHADD